jgi:two-component system, NarL family, nitrate/nitrite response regulator NarL
VTDGLVQTMTAIGHELGEFWSRRRGQLAPPLLTPREIQVLELAALGQTVPQMAESLSISAATAKTHLENIYRKLQASDRSAAVARALRLGLID